MSLKNDRSSDFIEFDSRMNKGGNEDFSFVHFTKDVQLFDIVF